MELFIKLVKYEFVLSLGGDLFLIDISIYRISTGWNIEKSKVSVGIFS